MKPRKTVFTDEVGDVETCDRPTRAETVKSRGCDCERKGTSRLGMGDDFTNVPCRADGTRCNRDGTGLSSSGFAAQAQILPRASSSFMACSV